MKKVLVIGSKSIGTKNDPQQLHDTLVQGGVEAKVVYWEDLEFSIETHKVSVRSGSEDIISWQPSLVVAVGWYKNGKRSLYRDVAYSLALVLTHAGIRFWNSEMGHQRSTSKLSALVQLALNGVTVPATRFSLGGLAALRTHPLPFVAKSPTASRGEHNYLVTTEAERALLVEHSELYLVQNYLENDHDLRIICLGGMPRLVLRRARSETVSTHLNNTSKGGGAQWIDMGMLPGELLTNCQKICSIMGREMAGIDFIPDQSAPGGYSCLEVNPVPQLTSGFDTTKKMEAFVDAIANDERTRV